MSAEAILEAIAAIGAARVQQKQEEAAALIAETEARATEEAAAAYEEARAAALAPLAQERAGRLHQANLKALLCAGQAREQLVAEVLAQVEMRLATLRQQPHYPALWRRLLREALAALGQEANNGCPLLAMDARDEALARAVLEELDLELSLATTLHTWGGMVVTSYDRRVVVANTLEERFAQATPYLRQRIAARLDALSAASARSVSRPALV